MKRCTLIAVLAAVMILAGSVFSFAAGGLELVSSYPENGQKNTSMENLGVKLKFNNPINSEKARAVDEGKFSIVDADGENVPIRVLFNSRSNEILVVAYSEKGFVAKNNEEYTLTIDAGLVDNDGNTLDQAQKITFRTYNQKVNNLVNMGMMVVMFGGIMVITLRQNSRKEEEEKKDEPKEVFNPYREAKRTGKSVEEVRAEQAKKDAKLRKKRARRAARTENVVEKRIENCAELLNNVYHVHAPAPVSKEDRSIAALKAARKAAGKKTGK